MDGPDRAFRVRPFGTSRKGWPPETIIPNTLKLTGIVLSNVVGFNNQAVSFGFGLNVYVEPRVDRFFEGVQLALNPSFKPTNVFTSPYQAGSSTIFFDVTGINQLSDRVVYPIKFKRQIELDGTDYFYVTSHVGDYKMTTPEVYLENITNVMGPEPSIPREYFQTTPVPQIINDIVISPSRFHICEFPLANLSLETRMELYRGFNEATQGNLRKQVILVTTYEILEVVESERVRFVLA